MLGGLQGGGQGGAAVVVPVFSNPRVDDAAPTNYAAGECAVELVLVCWSPDVQDLVGIRDHVGP